MNHRRSIHGLITRPGSTESRSRNSAMMRTPETTTIQGRRGSKARHTGRCRDLVDVLLTCWRVARDIHGVGGVRPSPPGGQVGDRRSRRPGEWLVPAARSRLGSWISAESSLSRIEHAGAAYSSSLSSRRADSSRFSPSSFYTPSRHCRCSPAPAYLPGGWYRSNLPLTVSTPGYLPTFPVPSDLLPTLFPLLSPPPLLPQLPRLSRDVS